MEKFIALFSILIAILPSLLKAQQVEADRVKCADRLLELYDSAQADEWLKVYVMLSDRVDIHGIKVELDAREASLEERTSAVIKVLREKAETTQNELLGWLDDRGAREVRPRWIANAIFADLQPAMLSEISRRADVAWIGLNAPLLPEEHQVEQASVIAENAAEPGLKTINAHKMWALGYSGYGRRSFTSDTGVDPTHPALSGKYLGAYVPSEQAWYQFNSSNSRPFDCGYHGTHVTGTILGLDRMVNDTIGVAFNALWMGGPTLCGVGTADNIEAFEWCMNPDGDPTTISDMPDVVNNSWYDPGLAGNDCQSLYTDVLTALEAVGVAVVFSAGNEGPGESTITPPKNINVGLVNTFAVAALNGNNSVAGFSSNGPSICDGSGSLKIKPEVSAPGVNVRSCLPDGDYGLLSGTSMAAPHAAGAILLLKEAFPYLTGEALKMALYLTCIDLGQTGEDNTFGMGLIDVYAAYEYLISEGNVPVSPAFQRDLLPSSLNLPRVNCDNAWTPEVTARNEGMVPVAGFTASITLDVGPQEPPVLLSAEWPDTLFPGDEATIIFPQLTNLPSGRHPLTVEIVPADGVPDDRPLNDRLYSRVLISNQKTADAEWERLSTLKACAGRRALLTSGYEGLGSVRWYDAPAEGNLLGEGTEFVTPPIDSTTPFFAEIGWSGGGITQFIPELATVPTSLDKGLVIDPKTDLTVVGCHVYAPEKTGCVVQIRDLGTDELIDQQSFLLEPGKNFLDFDIQAEAGKPLVFIHKFGKPLYYMDNEPEYPYTYGQFYSIPSGFDDGQLVTDAYFFFYDWEVAFEEVCDRKTIVVEVGDQNDLPIADFILSDTVLAIDEGTVLQASNLSTGGFGYVWRFGDGTLSELPNATHTYQQPGNYKVTLQVLGANGCSDAASRAVSVLQEQPIVTSSTTLQDETAGVTWGFYPNPATESITVFTGETSGDAAYTLFDASGKLCRHWSVERHSTTTLTLDLHGINTGLYLLRRVERSGERSTKLLSIVR